MGFQAKKIRGNAEGYGGMPIVRWGGWCILTGNEPFTASRGFVTWHSVEDRLEGKPTLTAGVAAHLLPR